MFCYETAINMLYWSALIYDYKQVRPTFRVWTGSCGPDMLLAYGLPSRSEMIRPSAVRSAT